MYDNNIMKRELEIIMKKEFEIIMEEYMIIPLIEIVKTYLSEAQLYMMGYMDYDIGWEELVDESKLMCEYLCNDPDEKKFSEWLWYDELIERLVGDGDTEAIIRFFRSKIKGGRRVSICNEIIKRGDKKHAKIMIREALIDEITLGIICISMSTDEDIELLEFQNERGHKFGIIEFNHAIKCGELKVLEWLLEHGSKYDGTAMNIAVQHNNIEVMEWIIRRGLPINKEEVFINGVKHATNIIILEMTDKEITEEYKRDKCRTLEWIRGKGFPYTPKVFEEAVKNNNYAAVEWLYVNKYAYNDNIIDIASESKFLFHFKDIICKYVPLIGRIYEKIDEIRDDEMREHDEYDITENELRDWYYTSQ